MNTADDWEESPAVRLDEAFGLLRRLPVGAVAWWVAGAVPMVLGVLFFWTDRTRSGAAFLTGMGWAMTMTALYVWLKVSQAFFARRVWSQLLVDGGLSPLGWTGWFRRTGALVLLAAVALPVQLLAVVLVLPIGWVSAFFHHATVVAYTHDLGPHPLRRMIRVAGRLAHHEPLAHHFSLLLLAVLSVLVWASVYALGLMVPYLVKILTGIESEFTRNPFAVALNPLYLAVTIGAAWLVIGPYVRVAYVGRTFQALSRRTGDDLMARLQAARRSVAAAHVTAGLLLGMLCWATPGHAVEQVEAASSDATVVLADAVEPPGAVEPAEGAAPAGALASPDARSLAEAIELTLSARDYQWRLSPGAAGAAEEEEWVGLVWMRETGRAIGNGLRNLDRFFSNARRVLRDWLGGGSRGSSPAAGDAGIFTGDALRGVLYLSGTLVLIALIVVAGWMLSRRRRVVVVAAPSAPGSPAVDLADEATLASALPEDEWLQLAKTQWEQGDLRLAVRAVFLATLASLGEQRLVDIARSKSNHDYLAEVQRRSLVRGELPEVFGRSIGVFERVWYGLHAVAPEWMPELLENHQRLSTRVPTA